MNVEAFQTLSELGAAPKVTLAVANGIDLKVFIVTLVMTPNVAPPPYTNISRN